MEVDRADLQMIHAALRIAVRLLEKHDKRTAEIYAHTVVYSPGTIRVKVEEENLRTLLENTAVMNS